jgi:hypothetical protein
MVGILLAIALAFVVADSFGDRTIEKFILTFLEWVEKHPYEGVLAVICVYIVATVLFVPGSILTLGTGYAFGSACDNTAYGVMLASTVCPKQCSSRVSVYLSLEVVYSPHFWSTGCLHRGFPWIHMYISFGEVSVS